MKSFGHVFWNWTVRKGIFALIIIFGMLTFINAQMSGSRGGIDSHAYQQPSSTSHKVVTHEMRNRIVEYIPIESKVEIRIVPDQIRIVLAISKNPATSSACEAKVFQKIDELKGAFSELNLPNIEIVDDFIAILPGYKYEIETQEGKRVLVEKLLDYEMQSNLHIKVASDKEALHVIRAAFKLGVTDIIGFDYWSKDLDNKKEEALKLAIEKTKSKSNLLLGATFDKTPEPINVKSSVRAVMPDKLYKSFENTHSQSVNQPYNYNKENLPVIRAIRPKNTYYRGYINEYADQHPADVPMSCEISVVAEVTMYFASPVARDYRAMESKAD